MLISAKKVIYVSSCFYPDPIGGTEVYVEALAQTLQKQGIQVIISAPDKEKTTYDHKGLLVQRFAISEKVNDLKELYGEEDPRGAIEFRKILDDEKPDLVHLHAFTRGCSLRLVHEAKRRGIPVVFTYHTPTVSCQRGTLMHWGKEVCDGVIDVRRCAACTLNGLGVNRPISFLLGHIPSYIGGFLASAGLSGGIWTALRITELLKLRHSMFHSLMSEVDHIVAVCQWVRELLMRNGVPPEKITISRQGLPLRAESEKERAKNGEQRAKNDKNSMPSDLCPLRIAFLGRMEKIKGAHVLIQALRKKPHLSATLDLYGIVQGKSGQNYIKRLKKLADGDSRISFYNPIPSAQVVSLLGNYDVLAVPSQWLETGPLVILEAFAAGIPVFGSNLGGITELVENEVNGLLVQPDSVEAWSQAIRRVLEDPGLLLYLRRGIRAPRRMEMVASEMEFLYRKFGCRE